MSGSKDITMISIRNLYFRYSGSDGYALNNINLTVEKGGFLGIIGSSGVGKTTLLQAMNGIIPHHFKGEFYGEVRVNGLDTFESTPENLARHIGSVRQDFDSQMVASVVEDEILFGLENFCVPRDEIESRLAGALEKTSISDLRDRSIATLSGGQKQKVAICAITALMPEILILDEPTGELDPQSSRQIFHLLRELNEKHGITVVVVEQKIMLLCEFAKELAVMQKGSILFKGSVRSVLRHSSEMEGAGVNCPRVVTLADRLAERGLYSGDIPLDVKEAETMVRRTIG
ncbi:MAG: ATP-binding cassette domain-containing protein [Synergistaceae bacterium]|nr:ATP-binding cassette domain-containing protein [Synergistaceae bacterium]